MPVEQPETQIGKNYRCAFDRLGRSRILTEGVSL